jgi:hypothetical protein
MTTQRTQREVAAIHEASHALLAHRLGLRLDHARIGGAGEGAVRYDESAHELVAAIRNPAAFEREVYVRVVVLAAGAIAEGLDGLEPEGYAGDFERSAMALLLLEVARLSDAATATERAAAQAHTERLIERACARAELELRAAWGGMQRLAAWLVGACALDAEAVAVALEGGPVRVLPCAPARLLALGRAADADGLGAPPNLAALARACERAAIESEWQELAA